MLDAGSVELDSSHFPCDETAAVCCAASLATCSCVAKPSVKVCLWLAHALTVVLIGTGADLLWFSCMLLSGLLLTGVWAEEQH